MKKFLIKSTVVFILFYFVLFFLEKSIDKKLMYNELATNGIWAKIFSGKLETDIAIFGSSRAQVHYDTELFLSKLDKKTFNFGVSGTVYNLLNIRWSAYMNRNKKPKTIILDLDETSFNTQSELFEKFQYLPYTSFNEYSSVAGIYDKDFYVEKYIPMYKYRGYEMYVLSNFTQPKIIENINSKNGFLGHDKNWKQKDLKIFKDKISKSNSINLNQKHNVPSNIFLLYDIIETCKKNDIKLFLIWSPSYYESCNLNKSKKDFMDKVYDKIAYEYDIKYFNFSNDSICFNEDLFYNSKHLNLQGARLFSEKVCDFILTDI